MTYQENPGGRYYRLLAIPSLVIWLLVIWPAFGWQFAVFSWLACGVIGAFWIITSGTKQKWWNWKWAITFTTIFIIFGFVTILIQAETWAQSQGYLKA